MKKCLVKSLNSWMLDVGGWMLEEVEGLKCWTLEVGCWMLDVGSSSEWTPLEMLAVLLLSEWAPLEKWNVGREIFDFLASGLPAKVLTLTRASSSSNSSELVNDANCFAIAFI